MDVRLTFQIKSKCTLNKFINNNNNQIYPSCKVTIVLSIFKSTLSLLNLSQWFLLLILGNILLKKTWTTKIYLTYLFSIIHISTTLLFCYSFHI